MKAIYTLLFALVTSVITFSQTLDNQGVAAVNSTRVSAQLANFEAKQKGNRVQLLWTALSESNMNFHEIQKSSNGSSFSAIGTVPAQNNAAPYGYTFTDATPVAGDNYYRLRSVDKRGDVTFSNILRVDNGFRRNDLVVLPNPVTNGVMNLQLSNFSSGKYNISLYSNAGQKIFARSMNFSDGSSTETINLPTNISRGTYFLQVTDGLNRINRQVLLQ
ncbi:MAG: type sorting protein [Segetibacter sp.]|nr:type sorting protein [Segetibacter sp.]